MGSVHVCKTATWGGLTDYRVGDKGQAPLGSSFLLHPWKQCTQQFRVSGLPVTVSRILDNELPKLTALDQRLEEKICKDTDLL